VESKKIRDEYTSKCSPDEETCDCKCYGIMSLHNAFQACFLEPGNDFPNKPTIEACQDTGASNLKTSDDFNFMRYAGTREGDETKHIGQQDMKVYGHNETQTIASKNSDQADFCYWEIVNDYRKKYLYIQDLILTFKEINDVDIYAVSYFRDDKESSFYFPSDIKKDEPMTFEMYNKTVIYMVKKSASAMLKFDFNIFQVELFQYGDNYNLITQLISGGGGIILVFSVIFYLDGFKELWAQIKEYQ
jgi:hypothetical protein